MALPASPVKSNYFSNIYSHSLTPQQQQGKSLALDAMNDLRLRTDYRFYDLAFGQAWELFFVIETEEVYDAAKVPNL